MMRIWSVFACAALLLLVACTSIGPTTIPRDRFDYSGALAESWKNQMLLNLVKMRYLDLPIYLEVGQIVSGYTLESTASIGGQIGNTVAGTNFFELGTTGRYVDRPTITYTPLTGAKYLEGFLSPIEMTKVLALIQAGFDAGFILELSVESLNGLRNQSVTMGSKYEADAGFFRALRLLREIQDAGAVGLRREESKDSERPTYLFFRKDDIHPDVPAKINELRAILRLEPGRSEYRLVNSPLPTRPAELAISTRSLSQVLIALSLGVDIPQPHVNRRLTPILPVLPSDAPTLLRVHSGSDRPADAFVAVRYEDEWFWIANDDWRSKRTFSSMLFLFTLADVSDQQHAPVLTIPTQ
jgi:hypothetical protein